MTRTTYTAAHWGIYQIETPVAGEGPHIRAFARDPDPSSIGLDRLDPAVTRLRIATPAVRKSWLEHGPGAAPERRGIDPFVQVPWNTAFDLVAGEIERVRGRYGNDGIFGGSYGWASAGRFHHAVGQLHRFLNSCGGYVRSVDSYSLGAGRALMPHIVTDMDDSNASHTSWSVLAEHTQLFVTFGGIPLKNTQVSSSGAGDHRVRDNIDTGGKIEWIPIRVNTDTALMLALAYVIRSIRCIYCPTSPTGACTVNSITARTARQARWPDAKPCT